MGDQKEEMQITNQFVCQDMSPVTSNKKMELIGIHNNTTSCFPYHTF